jgi:tetratricopeptide (TPR) repeat protein
MSLIAASGRATAQTVSGGGAPPAGQSAGQSRAQAQPQMAKPQSATPHTMGTTTGQPTPSASASKIDLKEDAAYKAFYDVPPSKTDELIRQGEAFLLSYPASEYRELVYSRLAQAYVVKQDYSKMEEDGEKALALKPNDVDALALLGWAIPHNYDPAGPNAAARLQKAEDYLRRALQILSTLQKPATISAEQFAQLSNDRLSQVHSGLGLVYFRRGQYPQAVLEFRQAVKLASSPDPIDLFVLGESLQQIQQYGEAAAAYDQCGKIPNIFLLRCQDNSRQVRQQTASQQSSANHANAVQSGAKP